MLQLSGERIGNYEILGLLGEGGMAVVYRARQINVGRDVAFKVIESRLANSPDFIKRFEREAHTIANLNHPHILKLFDFGHHEGLVYLVMELQPGGSLAQWLRNEGALPIEQVARYISQIGSALDYAHGRGVIHRDLKPQNVLLDEQLNAILTDFGVARIVGDVTALTGSGVAVGTPAYMAPEQWHGTEVDARTDLYTLAVMAYELLTARTPYIADTPPAMMYKHLHEQPTPLRELRAELPASIEQVLLKGMAKAPEERFQTAAEFAEAFQEAMTGKVPNSIKVNLPPRTKSAKPTTPVISTPTLARQKAAAAQNRSQLPLILGGLIALALIGILALLVGRSGSDTPALSAAGSETSVQIAADLSPTATETPTATFTATATATFTATATETPTATFTATATPTLTPSPTNTPSATLTPTATATFTTSPTPTATATEAPTLPPDLAAQATFFAEQTRLATVSIPTAYQQTLEANLTHIAQTFTATAWTATPTASATFTPSATRTPTFTPTHTPTPLVSPTPSLSPDQVFLVVLAPSLNVRSGPDTGFGVLGALSRDERIELIGTVSDYSWFAFIYRNGVTAWITANERLVNVIGDKYRLPILNAPRPQATSTRSPAGGGAPAQPTQPPAGGGAPAQPTQPPPPPPPPPPTNTPGQVATQVIMTEEPPPPPPPPPPPTETPPYYQPTLAQIY
jgi:serine/threonine protein kinase